MDPQSKKRLRNENESDSEIEEKPIKDQKKNPKTAKLSISQPSLIPKFPIPDNSSLSSKKPKLHENDSKKPNESFYSGILQCIKSIQDSIRHSDYDSMLSSLKKLSTELTMSNDENLSVLPVDVLTDSLLYSISIPESPEMALQSIICINSLIESNHNALSSFVKAGVVSQLTSKLMNIEYIDLAEYSVKALEKISIDFPVEVLREGFITEIFGVLDFFEQTVQKKILGIVVNTFLPLLCLFLLIC